MDINMYICLHINLTELGAVVSRLSIIISYGNIKLLNFIETNIEINSQ